MRVRLAATVLVGALALIGCGGQSGNSALAAVTLAATKTNEAGTARFATEMEMTIQGQTITGTGSGELDLERQLMHMEMTMQSPTGGGGIDSEMYGSGLTIYMRSAAMGAAAPGIKEWIEIDLAAAGEELGFDFGALQQLGQNDPTASLDYLRGAKSVEELGQEDVRGTSTTHYRAVVDWDSVVEESPEDVRDAMRANVEVLKEWMGADEMTFDVWLDDEGRMRRQTMEFAYQQGPAAGSTMDMTVEMFDFGADIVIQLPDPSEVTSFKEVMEQLQPSG